MNARSNSLVGVGLYSIPEAARLLRIPSRKLRRWADGYTFRVGESERFSGPVLQSRLRSANDVEFLTFLDLMELKFVGMFRQEGVSMKVIRDAAAVGAKLFETDHPFAVKRFDTDGRRIFATLDKGEARPTRISDSRLVQELHISQYVFGRMVRPFFRKLDSGDKEILRYWPLGKNKRVVLDPQRAFGKPIDAETGVPTFVLYQASQSGEPRHRIAAWYNVPLAAVSRAVEYETSILPS